MTSIQKRPDGKWRARYRDDRHHEYARHFTRKIDAQRWLDQVTSAVVTGTYVDPAMSKVTVGEWSSRWIDAQLQLKPSTRARYEGILRCQVLPTWATVSLSDVTHSGISAWVTRLSAQGLAPATVRQAHRVLSLVLSLAVRDERLPRNPANQVPLPRAHKPEKRFLTHAQVADLADAAGDYGLAIQVLAYCGLRFGELAALRVGRVDLLRRRILIAESVTEVNGKAVFGTPKTHQQRSVPVPRSIVEELAVQLAGRATDDYVFSAPGGGVLRLTNFRRRCFDQAAMNVGLPGLTPHELRHTAASLAVSAGANVKSIQRMLGHASAAMTLDVYSGLFDADLDAVADRLDEAFALSAADSSRTSATVLDFARSPMAP